MPDVEVDLHPAAEHMTAILASVPDDALEDPTPCPEYSVGGLVTHVGGLAQVFTAAACKDLGELTSRAPQPTGTDLEPEWRDRITSDLATLADAWTDPGAWDGMTQAGGVGLPGAIAGRVAMNELVVHAWDLARATGQDVTLDDATARIAEQTIELLRDGQDGDIPGLFGPVVAIPDDAPPLDQVVALAGRDPSWSPT